MGVCKAARAVVEAPWRTGVAEVECLSPGVVAEEPSKKEAVAAVCREAAAGPGRARGAVEAAEPWNVGEAAAVASYWKRGGDRAAIAARASVRVPRSDSGRRAAG